MVRSESFGSNGKSNLGGELAKSLLESATLVPAIDDNSALLGLVRELKTSAAWDPFSVELDRLSKAEIEKGNNGSQSPQNVSAPISRMSNGFDHSSLLFNSPGFFAPISSTPQDSKSKTNKNTPGFDLLTGSTSNTPLVHLNADDPLTNTASNLGAKADTQRPRITAALVNDTAPSGTNRDGITFDPTIAGKITGTNQIKKFEAGFDNTPPGKYFSVLPDLKPDGSFTLNRNRLEQIYGGTIPDGLHTLHLWVKDERGNSHKLLLDTSFTLDTIAPAAPQSLDLLAQSDSGFSNSDNCTNNTTPIISGTAPSGELVQLFSNGQLVGQTTVTERGFWQLATTQLTDGIHTLTAATVDVAGNVSLASAPLNVIIDTQAPTAPSSLRLTASTDTGASSSDNITNNTTPTIQGTGEASSLIRLFKGEQHVGQTTAAADGSWEIAVGELSDGLYNFTAMSEDAAGNVSATSSQLEVTIDTVTTAPIGLDLLAGSDSGQSNSDNITNSNTPAIAGTAEAGALVQLFSDGQLVGQTTVTPTSTWQIATGQLVDGTHALTAIATDVAGNVSQFSAPINVAIDTHSPDSPSSLRLSAETDTGLNNSDGVTSNSAPTIAGNAEAGSKVRLFNWGQLVAQTTVAADGSWQLSVTTLSDGLYNFSATSEDIAGNISTSSDQLAVTIDTVAAAPTDLDLLATSDSGSSNSDNNTNNPTPTISGFAEPGALVQLFSDGQLVGQTTATANTTWQIATSQLTDGTHMLTATATDVAGNVSPISSPLNLAIDTIAPIPPSSLRLTPSTDTGASNSDNLTNNTAPTIQGTGEAGALIRLFKGGQLVGQTTAAGDGSWLFSVAESLGEGAHTFTAIAEDSAGNVSATSGQLVVTINTTKTDTSLMLALADLYGLDPYPDAIALVTGSTRQMSVKLNGLPDSPDFTTSSTGTRYSVSDPEVLSISPDGLITALKEGAATVTVSYGEEEVAIPVRVTTPQLGPVTLGVDGGVVQASNGSMVMIAPGALEENTTVSLTPLGLENLSLPVPEGFEFAGAFDLSFGDDRLSVAAQLAIPAPAGLPADTQVYFMRKGALPDETGTWNQIWLQEESGIVGADGIIRTQSPPYPGVVRPGEYMVAYASPTGSATLVKGQITLNYNFPLAFFGIIIPGKAPGKNFGQLLDPNYFVATSAFSVTYDISSVKVIAVPTVGLPVVTTVGVQRNANGIATFEAALDMPAPADSDPMAPPTLQKVELKFKDENNQPFENNEPVLFLTGSNVLVNNSGSSLGSRFDDLIVDFHVGNQVYQGTVLPNLSRELGDNQFEVAVKVPNTTPIGASRIVLSRRQNDLVGQNRTEPMYEEALYSSNEIRLRYGGEYVFAALRFSDQVAVLNGSNPESVVETTRSNDLLLARIPVGTQDLQDWPRALASTSDGTRTYVALERSGRVALVDPLVLQQVDTNSQTPDVVDPINLPAGASPLSIVISPRDEYAYIADGKSGSIYVLDINPFSATYHQVIQTISVNPAPTGLRQMTISSDGRKLFVTAPNLSSSSKSQILAVNIDPKDRPRDPNQNLNKWHQQIGAVTADQRVEGIAATTDPMKMTFTNRRSDATGFGVLTITNDDPKSFTATTRYAGLTLGSIYDYFDVNEGVAVTVMGDGSYAFVAGYNGSNFGSGVESIDGVQAGSNIGIIKDPLTNPRLVAATRPIPLGLTTDLVLSNDNKYLYASYPNAGGVYVFDVEEIINTLNHPGNYVIDQLDRGIGSPFFDPNTANYATSADLSYVPIDDINPAISIAADYEILQEDRPRNQFTYGIPSDTTRAPIGTGGSPRGLAASPADWLDLIGPGTTTTDLTPTLDWQFDPGMEDVREVNLFVSTFSEGEGLLPWDKVVDLSDSSFLLNLSSQQKRELLTKPWNGYDDFNPGRILTATWKKETNTWYWHDGTTAIAPPVNDPLNTSTRFTLPDDRILTAGQNYHWAIQAVSSRGKTNIDFGQFKTLAPPTTSPFSSVTVLTHGFTYSPSATGIPNSFYDLADSIAETGNDGLILRYDKSTGFWIAVDERGRVLQDLTTNLKPSDSGYLAALANGIRANYLNQSKALVLLPQWSLGNESVIPDSGFTEAAADAFFTSLVQLDQALGGDTGFNNQGRFVRNQGAVLNSPLHFIGFSRGAVVNSEIIQRLGVYFPNAGGTDKDNRDLQMTTIDPHDFDQPSLGNFRDLGEPKVQVWENVTFADNYYQTLADPNGLTLTPNGRDIPDLPAAETSKNPLPPGLVFPRNEQFQLLGQPDLPVLLNGRTGFTKDDGVGGSHGRTLAWYAGTVDLDLNQVEIEGTYQWGSTSQSASIYDQLGERDLASLLGQDIPSNLNPWYSGSGSAEGVATGWFYSVLGGGKSKRPKSIGSCVRKEWD